MLLMIFLLKQIQFRKFLKIKIKIRVSKIIKISNNKIKCILNIYDSKICNLNNMNYNRINRFNLKIPNNHIIKNLKIKIRK